MKLKPLIFSLIVTKIRLFLGLLKLCNPFWWFRNNINPYFELKKKNTMIFNIAFRLDILKQNIFGRRSKFFRRIWIKNIETTFLDDIKSDKEFSPLVEFDYKKEGFSIFFETYYRKQTPVVFRGLLFEDSEFKPWDMQEFLDKYGENETVLTCPVVDGYKGKLKEIKIPGVYVQNTEDILNNNPELFKKMALEKLAQTVAKPFMFSGITQLFAGQENTGTWWHCAGGMNFFLMLHGKKKWSFIDPEFSPLMLPLTEGHGKSMYFLSTQIKNSKIYQKNYQKLSVKDQQKMDRYLAEEVPQHIHDLFSKIPKFEVELNPGDVLFNPPWWWHEVENITESTIAVATRWFDVHTPKLSNDIFDLGTRFNLPFFYELMFKAFSQTLIKDQKINIHSNNIRYWDKTTRASDINSYTQMNELVTEYYKRFDINK